MLTSTLTETTIDFKRGIDLYHLLHTHFPFLERFLVGIPPFAAPPLFFLSLYSCAGRNTQLATSSYW